jgi:hypothetical protein
MLRNIRFKANKFLRLMPFFIFLFVCSAKLISGPENQINLKGYYDGPYISYQGENVKVIRVLKSAEGAKTTHEYFSLKEIKEQTLKIFPDSRNPDSTEIKPFSVELFDFQVENIWEYEQPEKVFALSDIECKFSNYESILKAGGVIDENYNWIYGKGHLVVNGDLFDRGLDLMAVLWLTYKLDYESTLVGGKVHVLLGNHEEMVLRGDVRYVEKRYLEFCDEIGIPYQDLFGANTEIGKWLRTKNTIVKIGKNLFVHGGISKEFIERGISIADANHLIRENLGKNRSELEGNVDFLFRSNGPFWYRGMVLTSPERNPLNVAETSVILNNFNVSRAIVGHCIVPDIIQLRDGLVVAIDVDHNKNRIEGKSRALIILTGQNTDEKLLKINDAGELSNVNEI